MKLEEKFNVTNGLHITKVNLIYYMKKYTTLNIKILIAPTLVNIPNRSRIFLDLIYIVYSGHKAEFSGIQDFFLQKILQKKGSLYVHSLNS